MPSICRKPPSCMQNNKLCRINSNLRALEFVTIPWRSRTAEHKHSRLFICLLVGLLVSVMRNVRHNFGHFGRITFRTNDLIVSVRVVSINYYVYVFENTMSVSIRTAYTRVRFDKVPAYKHAPRCQKGVK